MTVYGSHLVFSDLMRSYKKDMFQVPVFVKHLLEFVKLLMVVISLKRIVRLNYEIEEQRSKLYQR